MSGQSTNSPAENLAGIITKTKIFLTNHSKTLKIIFYTVLSVLVIIAAQSQLRGINRKAIRSALHIFDATSLTGIVVFALAAFFFTGLYDVVGAHYCRKHAKDAPEENHSKEEHTERLRLFSALKIGWKAQAFNNFVGLGGLTGGTVRTSAYKRYGVSTSTALRITLSVWIANLLGLFALLILTAPLAFKFEHWIASVPLLIALVAVPLYLFGEYIPIKKIKLHSTPLGYLDLPHRATMLLASIADWLAAALFFSFCIQIFIPEAHTTTTIYVYATGTLVGLLSFVPSGLGTFDLTVVTLFTSAGYSVNDLVVALAIYRVAYYVLPWFLATISMVLSAWYRHDPFDVYTPHGGLICNTLALGMTGTGLVLILSVLTPEVFIRIKVLRHLLPHFALHWSQISALLIGILLILLARGIYYRVRRCFFLSLLLLGLGVISAMLKGLDYEEAILLAVFGLLLALSERYFIREPLNFNWQAMFSTFLIALGVPLTIYVLRDFTRLFPRKLEIHLTYTTIFHWTFLLILLTAVAMASMFSWRKNLEFKPPTLPEVQAYSDLIETYGGNEYSHLFYLFDKSVFFNSDKTVAFLYKPVRSHILVLADPIGDPKNFSTALGEFLSFAAKNHADILFYQISSKFLEPCWNAGISIVKIGEDALVNLSELNFVGNKGKKFRRMLNRMEEKGNSFEIWQPPYTRAQLEALKEVSVAWIAGRDELGYSLGYFAPHYISRTPVAVVKTPENRVEGFATLQPINGKSISVDLMRIRPDASGGTMDAIFVHLLRWAKAEGFTSFYLGMAPMSNSGVKLRWRNHDKLVRSIFLFGRKIYNFGGLREYKEKFNPHWYSRYLAYSSARALPGAISALLEVVRKIAEIHYVEGSQNITGGPIQACQPHIDVPESPAAEVPVLKSTKRNLPKNAALAAEARQEENSNNTSC